MMILVIVVVPVGTNIDDNDSVFFPWMMILVIVVVPWTQKQSGGSHGSKTAHEYALPPPSLSHNTLH